MGATGPGGTGDCLQQLHTSVRIWLCRHLDTVGLIGAGSQKRTAAPGHGGGSALHVGRFIPPQVELARSNISARPGALCRYVHADGFGRGHYDILRTIAERVADPWTKMTLLLFTLSKALFIIFLCRNHAGMYRVLTRFIDVKRSII